MINGKPMVQWVIDAYAKHNLWTKYSWFGLDESDEVQFRKPVVYLQDTGGLLENMQLVQPAAAQRQDELIFIVS